MTEGIEECRKIEVFLVTEPIGEYEYADPEHPGPTGWTSGMPFQRGPVNAALARVQAEADAYGCDLGEFDACGGSNPGGTGIGWVLFEDDDNPHAGGLRFTEFYLIDAGGDNVAAVCEACAPENLYPVAALAVRKKIEAYAVEVAKRKAEREAKDG